MRYLRFSPEIREVLIRNPVVTNVSGSRIWFSKDFKKKAYSKLLLGKSIEEIFIEEDIEPGWLGEDRMIGFVRTLNQRFKDNVVFFDASVHESAEAIENLIRQKEALVKQVKLLNEKLEHYCPKKRESVSSDKDL